MSRGSLQPLLEVLALEPLHREVERAARRRPVGDVADDRRVRELGEDPRLAREAVGDARRVGAQGLQGDALAVDAIEGAKDRPHRPGAGELFDLEPIADDLAAPHAWGVSHGPWARGSREPEPELEPAPEAEPEGCGGAVRYRARALPMARGVSRLAA